MLDILRDLEAEYIGDHPDAPVVAKPVKKSGALKAAAALPAPCAARETLWDVVATPAMMRAFSSTVASSGAVAVK